MKKCLLVIVSGLVGKLDRRARKPWITKKLPVKWMKKRKWKNVRKEERRKKLQMTQERIKKEPQTKS